MTRDEITQQIIAARLANGLTWQQLADAIGKPVVWTTADTARRSPEFTRATRRLRIRTAQPWCADPDATCLLLSRPGPRRTIVENS